MAAPLGALPAAADRPAAIPIASRGIRGAAPARIARFFGVALLNLGVALYLVREVRDAARGVL